MMREARGAGNKKTRNIRGRSIEQRAARAARGVEQARARTEQAELRAASPQRRKRLLRPHRAGRPASRHGLRLACLATAATKPDTSPCTNEKGGASSRRAGVVSVGDDACQAVPLNRSKNYPRSVGGGGRGAGAFSLLLVVLSATATATAATRRDLPLYSRLPPTSIIIIVFMLSAVCCCNCRRPSVPYV